MALTVDGRTKWVDLGLTNTITTIAQDPLNANAFYFIYAGGGSNYKLYRFVWPSTLTIIANMSLNGASPNPIPNIAWNPASSAYHFGFMMFQGIGDNIFAAPVDVNLSTGIYNQESPNVNGFLTNSTGSCAIYSFVDSGFLYFCWSGPPGGTITSSYGGKWRASGGDPQYMTASLGQIDQGLIFPMANNGEFMHSTGSAYKILKFLTMTTGVVTNNPFGTTYRFGGAAYNYFSDGYIRYYCCTGSGTNRYIARYNVITGDTDGLLIANTGSFSPRGGLSLILPSGLLSYITSANSNTLNCGRLVSGISLSTDNMDSIVVDANNGVNPAQATHCFITLPYVYVFHTLGISGPAVTREILHFLWLQALHLLFLQLVVFIKILSLGVYKWLFNLIYIGV